MKRTTILAIAIVLVIIASLAAVKTLQIRTLIAMGKSFAPLPETISSAVAHEEQWQDSLSAIGSLYAVQGVTITPELAGKVSEIRFESGAVAAAGDLLLKLDTSSEEAQLRAGEAQAQLARLNVERVRQLRADNAVSQSELDTAEATVKQLEANADTIRAAIAKKTIRAPFAGQLGIRLVSLGENLDLGKPIVSLQSLSLVCADFSLPQQELARVKPGMAVRLSIDAYPDKFFEGKLTAINPALDADTRSVRLQATFESAEQLLRPGMFARVQVLLPGDQTVLVIPSTAVLSAPFGDSVYVVENSTNATGGLVVRQQFIRTGRGRGDFVSVESGLKPGERVASSGLFKLRNGQGVVENNALAPKASEKPNPPNG